MCARVIRGACATAVGCALVLMAAVALGEDDARKPSMKVWYLADGLAMPADTTPETAVNGALGQSFDWTVIHNLTDKDTEVKLTHYFEDAPPSEQAVKVPARSSVSFGGHGELPESMQPKRKLFGTRIESPVPVIVQGTRAEQEASAKPPVMPGRSFLGRTAIAGPLGQPHTAWLFTDSVVQRKNPRAIEHEWLTVLNPSKEEAKVKLTINNGKRQATHEFTVPAERVRSIKLEDIEAMPDDRVCGLVVESSIPVAVEQVRRYSFRWHPAPAGTYVVPGFAVGDLGLALPTHPMATK